MEYNNIWCWDIARTVNLKNLSFNDYVNLKVGQRVYFMSGKDHCYSGIITKIVYHKVFVLFKSFKYNSERFIFNGNYSGYLKEV